MKEFGDGFDCVTFPRLFVSWLLELLGKTNLSHDGMTVSFFKTLEPPHARWRDDQVCMTGLCQVLGTTVYRTEDKDRYCT